ncbi:MAG: hypothetical protein AAFO94_00495 [Bacteroidota bacterium]
MFNTFIESDDYNGSYLKEARKAIGECDWAIEVLAVPKEGYEVSILGDEVNSVFSEFAPVMLGDTLYFSSQRFTNEADLHEPPRQVSKLMYQSSDETVATVPDINRDRILTGHSSFNAAGTRMYYTVCAYTQTGDIPCRIHSRDRQADGTWGEAVKLPELINQPVTTATQPNVGRDQDGNEVLYFVSDRPGGKGELDIWYAAIKENNQFGMPMNLTKVNTEKNDITPFWQESTKSLYFSTEGFKTLGGYDVYQATVKDGAWETPRHLGAPVNSSYDDLYYSVDAENASAFLSSNRPGARYIEKSKLACCNDIFEVSITPIAIAVKLLLFDADTRAPIQSSTIDFTESPDKLLFSRINRDGNDFIFEVRKNKDYIFKANHPNYLSDTVMVSTQGWQESDTLVREVYLQQKPAGSLLNLKTLVFDASTKLPLIGATVEVLDETMAENDRQYNELSNDFTFEVMGQHRYTIKVMRTGYEPETLSFLAEDIQSAYTFVKKFYLTPLPLGPVDKGILASYLPLPVYFDNDSPNSGSRQSTTDVVYTDIAPGYYGKKSEFNEFYTKGLIGVNKVKAEDRIVEFFDHEVNRGSKVLNSFTARLLIYLRQGNTAEIRIKGYASPRAEDEYNLILTRRRIASLINHFRSFDNGALQPYLNNGQFVISQQPFGEALAPEDVSDDLDDLRNSIYSIPASRERRVEIVEIK